jgi:hypothetical protein
MKPELSGKDNHQSNMVCTETEAGTNSNGFYSLNGIQAAINLFSW